MRNSALVLFKIIVADTIIFFSKRASSEFFSPFLDTTISAGSIGRYVKNKHIPPITWYKVTKIVENAESKKFHERKHLKSKSEAISTIRRSQLDALTKRVGAKVADKYAACPT